MFDFIHNRFFFYFQNTTRVKEHIPCGFSYKVVTAFEGYKKPVVVYRDNGTGDVASVFMAMLYEEYEDLYDLLHADEPMSPLTDQQTQSFTSSTSCYLCTRRLTADDKVRDHCHYT